MPTEKDLAFVKFIRDSTEGGNVEWEATATEAEYIASFKGKYNVSVQRTFDEDRDVVYSLTLRNAADNREMLRIYEYDRPGRNVNVPVIFHLAQRSALNVDAAIDEIMGE